MRNIFLAIVFVICAGAYCMAQEECKETGGPAAPVAAEQAKTEDLTPIDVGAVPAERVESEAGVGESRMMPPSDTYDQNTGLPNVTESDTAGELE